MYTLECSARHDARLFQNAADEGSVPSAHNNCFVTCVGNYSFVGDMAMIYSIFPWNERYGVVQLGERTEENVGRAVVVGSRITFFFILG